MLRTSGLLAALAIAFTASQAVAQGRALDRNQTLDQVLANCDPATGLPRGVRPAAAAGPRRKVVIAPNWLKQPDARDVAAAYPPAAKSAHVGGKAVVHCVVGSDGHARDCRITDEMPPGMGFGEAAVALSGSMLFAPKRIDCAPVDDGQISIPISFPPA